MIKNKCGPNQHWPIKTSIHARLGRDQTSIIDVISDLSHTSIQSPHCSIKMISIVHQAEYGGQDLAIMSANNNTKIDKNISQEKKYWYMLKKKRKIILS